MSSLKRAIPALAFLFGGCYVSNEEVFPTSNGDTLPIGSVVACVYPKPNGQQEFRYQVERFAFGDKSQYRFEGNLMTPARLVAFHKIGTSTWIFAAKSAASGGQSFSQYAYGVIRLRAKGEFALIQHTDALRDRLAGAYGVNVKENVLIGDVANQKRFLLVLATEPGEVGGICTSN
jgi:hypothetical protein